MAAKIFLFRHGETSWSLTGQHTGRTDLPLTENGEHRASSLRKRLRGLTFDHVLASPLQRARRTCELAGFGDVIRIEPDIQEWNYGAYEGKTTDEIQAQRPGWNVFQDGCPEGESVDQISQRADRVLASLRSLEGTVALFSHGQFLRVLAVRWLCLPVLVGRNLALDTGSISILGFEHPEEDTPSLLRWNAGPPSDG